MAPHDEQKLSPPDNFGRAAAVCSLLVVCACGFPERQPAADGKQANAAIDAAAPTVRSIERASCEQQADGLDADLQSLAATFCKEARSKGVPGALMGIRAGERDQVRWISWGVDCVGRARGTNSESIFPIASLTKSASALVVLDLLDKNRRSLEDAIGETDGSPRVIHLLQQSSGLRPRGAHATRAPSAPLASWFDPGELWHYDNFNYERLGRWVAEAGWNFETAWSTRFAASGPTLRRPANEPLVCEHVTVSGRSQVLERSAGDTLNLAGGAWASAEQLWKMLDQIAAEPRLRERTFDTGEGDRYGLGLRIEGQTWSHAGARPGGWSWMMESQAGARVLLLANQNLALEDTRSQVRMQLFGLEPAPAVEAITHDEIAGEYGVRGWQRPLTIRVADGGLRMDLPELGTLGVRLRPQGRNRFDAHLPMNQGSETLVFVRREGQIWARSPWFVGRKEDAG